MYELPKLDLEKLYQSRRILPKAKTGNVLNLQTLLNEIQNEKDPNKIKYDLLGIIQLFFNGLVDPKTPAGKWKERGMCLENLIRAGKLAIGQFYRGEGIDVGRVKEIILPSEKDILKYGSKSEKMLQRNLGELSNEGIQRWGIETYNQLGKNMDIPDSVLCIANGGFEPSLLVSDMIGSANFIAARYSINRRSDQKVLVPRKAPRNYFSSKIGGKTILVVDDHCHTGNTIQTVLNQVLRLKPTQIYVGVISSYCSAQRMLDKLAANGNGTIINKGYPTILKI